MRLLVTADLHFDIDRSVQPTRDLARRVLSEGGDALLIAGDVCGLELEPLAACFALFEDFHGEKMFVAGNHDLWVPEGGDSLRRYEREISEACRSAGFRYLDESPATVGDVGFVGSVGWYDYSYRDPDLGVPLRFYEAKTGPGYAAAAGGRWLALFDGHDDVPRDSLGITVRWMDGEHVRLPFGDVEFAERLAAKLEADLAAVAPASRTIVAAVHHIPFREMIPRHPSPAWTFGSAFMGSARFGDALRAEPKVRHVFCGHSHRADEIVLGGLRCVNVGSTYVEKRIERLEI